jgi:hypothetical protein
MPSRSLRHLAAPHINGPRLTALLHVDDPMVLLTALHYGLVADQVDPDLHILGLTSLRCVTAQRPC